jgi:NADH-quinone oxidoreductase subunit N
MPNLTDIVVRFAPELILALGALVILGYDLVVRGQARVQLGLTVVALLAAMVATLWLYTVPSPAQPQSIVALGGLTVTCGQDAIFEARAPVSTVPQAPPPVVRCGAFAADAFTQFFRLFGQIAALLVVLAGAGFMRRRTPFGAEFFSILLFATAAMSLMAGAADLILIALSIEFLSLSSYILTAFLRGDAYSSEAGLKYFLYGAVTSAVMLFGLSLLFGTAGTTSVPVIAAVLGQPQAFLPGTAATVALPGLAMVLVGLSFKTALVPFHQWSPDAYEGAPTPVTAFLSVGPKMAGFAVLLRLLMAVFPSSAYSSSWIAVLTTMAVLTMVVGNVVALSQDNIKRMMAYSSIAQAGFMLVGLAAWAQSGPAGTNALAAVLVYLLAYVFTNLGAFAVIIAVDDAQGSSHISGYAGLMQRSPQLAVALAVFFLSLVGIPPLAGFIGKFSVFRAAIDGGQAGLAVVGVLTGVISVGYYFRVLREVFFRPPGKQAAPVPVAPGLRLVVVSSLVMTLLIGIFAGPFLDYAAQAAGAISPLASSAAGMVP